MRDVVRLRRMFTAAAAMTVAMPSLIAGIFLANLLGFHGGDEGKTMAIAVSFALLCAIGAGMGASRVFGRLSGPRQAVGGVLGFGMASTLYLVFLAHIWH